MPGPFPKCPGPVTTNPRVPTRPRGCGGPGGGSGWQGKCPLGDPPPGTQRGAARPRHAPRRAARRYLVAVQPARGLDPRGKNPVGTRSEFGAAGWRGIRGRVRLRAPSPSMIIAGDRHGHRMDSQRRSLVTQALLAERRFGNHRVRLRGGNGPALRLIFRSASIDSQPRASVPAD